MALPVRHRDLTSERMQLWEPFRELEQRQEATAQLLENARPRHIEVESAAQ